MIKYAAFSGYIYSADGDRHFIPARRVVELYGANPRECICFASVKEGRGGRYGEAVEDLISLFPRSDGDYDLPHSRSRQTGKKVK